jgi:methanogenic corrinoid protein MtbC1
MNDDIFGRLVQAVVDMDIGAARYAASEALAEGIDAYDAVAFGLARGMEEAGARYDRGEYFVPELICCADSMYAGLEILRPHIAAEIASNRPVAVVGVVEGDTHDIGKNIVVMMLEAAGFDVHDLGNNVPAGRFVLAVSETGATILGLSALMTTTRDRMREVIELISADKRTSACKVMVGGAAITSAFATHIEADGYARDAIEAMQVAKRLSRKEEMADVR